STSNKRCFVTGSLPRLGRGRLAAARQGEQERRPLAGRALDLDGPAVGLDDALADRQARARPLELVAAVQPAEDAEDLLVVRRVDADAVVADEEGDHPRRAVAVGRPVPEGQLRPGLKVV